MRDERWSRRRRASDRRPHGITDQNVYKSITETNRVPDNHYTIMIQLFALSELTVLTTKPYLHLQR